MEDFILPPKPECLEDFREAAKKLRFDPAKYAHHLAEYDLTEAQQLMLMRVVWDFMVMVADAGFEIDAVSLASDEAETPEGDQTQQKDNEPKEDRSP